MLLVEVKVVLINLTTLFSIYLYVRNRDQIQNDQIELKTRAILPVQLQLLTCCWYVIHKNCSFIDVQSCRMSDFYFRSAALESVIIDSY